VPQFVPRNQLDALVTCDDSDVLLVWDGSAGESFTGARGVVGSTLVLVVPAAGIDRRFLYYFLRSQSRTLTGKTVGSTIPHVSRTVFEALRFPILDLREQKRIADQLDVIRDAIQVQDSAIDAVHRLKAAVRNHVLMFGPVSTVKTGAVRTKPTPVGPMPDHWYIVPLRDVARVERGKFSHRPRNDPAFYGGDAPFIQTGDVTAAAAADGRIRTHSQTLNDKGLSVSRIFPKGTIAITIAANIGYAAVLEFDSAFPDSVIGITPSSAVSTDFLNHYLATQRSEMDRRAPRGTQKNINIQFLEPWPVKVPPLEEQIAIERILNLLDEKLSLERAGRVELGRLFVSALTAEMTRVSRRSEKRSDG